MTEENGAGLSRRDLIKRGAVVGGVVWAAPVVQSLTSPAFAGTPGGGECENFFRFKFNVVDGVAIPDDGTSTPDCTIPDFGTTPLGNDRVTVVLSGPYDDGDPTTVTVSDNTGDTYDCTVEFLVVKAGSGDGACTADTNDDGTVTTSDGKGISYVAGIICCD